MSPMAHAFVRLRLLHPVLALATGLVVMVAASVARITMPAPRVRAASKIVTVLFAAQVGAGLLNVTLLAPVWMQLVHLLLADATWIALVLLATEAARQRENGTASQALAFVEGSNAMTRDGDCSNT
jgi:heme A synthase